MVYNETYVRSGRGLPGLTGGKWKMEDG